MILFISMYLHWKISLALLSFRLWMSLKYETLNLQENKMSRKSASGCWVTDSPAHDSCWAERWPAGWVFPLAGYGWFCLSLSNARLGLWSWRACVSGWWLSLSEAKHGFTSSHLTSNHTPFWYLEFEFLPLEKKLIFFKKIYIARESD